MINKVLGILAAVVCIGGVAQAQTTTLIDTSYYSLPVVVSGLSFDVSGPSSVFIEGAQISAPSIAGLGFLTGPSGYSETFALTNGTTIPNVVFNTFTLTTPGEYTFSFDFANLGGSTVGAVGITATVTTPVPEPQTYAMLLAGLFIVGFTTRRRLFG
jgi:hypothetical protein